MTQFILQHHQERRHTDQSHAHHNVSAKCCSYMMNLRTHGNLILDFIISPAGEPTSSSKQYSNLAFHYAGVWRQSPAVNHRVSLVGALQVKNDDHDKTLHSCKILTCIMFLQLFLTVFFHLMFLQTHGWIWNLTGKRNNTPPTPTPPTSKHRAVFLLLTWMKAKMIVTVTTVQRVW